MLASAYCVGAFHLEWHVWVVSTALLAVASKQLPLFLEEGGFVFLLAEESFLALLFVIAFEVAGHGWISMLELGSGAVGWVEAEDTKERGRVCSSAGVDYTLELAYPSLLLRCLLLTS